MSFCPALPSGFKPGIVCLLGLSFPGFLALPNSRLSLHPLQSSAPRATTTTPAATAASAAPWAPTNLTSARTSAPGVPETPAPTSTAPPAWPSARVCGWPGCRQGGDGAQERQAEEAGEGESSREQSGEGHLSPAQEISQQGHSLGCQSLPGMREQQGGGVGPCTWEGECPPQNFEAPFDPTPH